MTIGRLKRAIRFYELLGNEHEVVVLVGDKEYSVAYTNMDVDWGGDNRKLILVVDKE